MKIKPYFLLLRPKQWIKNLLVFAVPLASKDIFGARVFIDCLVAFIVFAMASSSVYAWNDIRDREEDKYHPVKSSRPVASGAVGVKSAVFLSIASLSLSLIVGGYFGNLDLVVAVIAYLVIQVLYQLRLRDVPLFDIAIISSGFVLRAIAGGLAAGIYISVWFLSVTASASLFIVGAKRYSEILRNSQAESNRKVLTVYTPTYLRLIWSSSLVSTVTFYALWSAEVQIASDSMLSKYSVIPFLFIFLKYAIYADKGEAESPEVIVFSDRGIQLLAVIWALTFLI
jgi:decaprenyl-phosphate phosphoribosyltransferase